ncbi:uncharacterized protein LOC124257975 [Haliotis rubra]|uniref:uncharacterized protein LOC124257975 n=1 Tax=Haliotis rubra TaxID=36100 RepID=UPI001EE5BDF9|nr:uncharacterized protein LOC124257975 [Haliotis rubra]
MASNDAGSRNICARLVLNEKGTLTITEDPTASIPSTKRNQLLSVTGPGGEVKEFFYGKAPNVQAAPRIDPPDKTDSTHVPTSTSGPNKSVLTESQAKSLAVMLSSVNSHVTANEHWALDHSYTMKEKTSLAPPVVILAPVVVPTKQTQEESQPGKQVFESIKCSPSSIKPSVYGSANESSYEIMTSPPSYSTGHQSSGSSLQAVSGHLPKPNLLPTCSTTTDASTKNRQSKSEGASEILRQLSASVPVTVGHTSSLTTGPRFQSSQGLNRIPQTTVSNKQGTRPSILGGTGNLKSKQTGSQTGNVIQKPTGVLGCLRDMVTANLKDKGQDVSFNAQSGKDVLNTTQTVSIPSQKPPLNVPVQKRLYPGGAYVDTYPHVRQKNIHNQNDIDPVLQRMLKNVQKASASLKETLPVPVSDAFKPQSTKNVSEKGNGHKEVIVRVYPDKPVVAVKPDPMRLVNPQSVLPVLTAPQIAFVPDTMQTYYMPVVMTQTSNSFPLVYNQCLPSGSAGKTIIVTTNTQNQVPIAPATNRETLPTNSNEHGPVNNKGLSFSVPSKPEPKIDAFIDQHNYAAVPKEVDMALPRIESVFSLTPSQDTGTQKQDLNKDILKVTPNSETDSCLNPGKTKLRKVESVKIEDSSESSSCLNPGKTALRKVESARIDGNSESSSCLNPGKTKVRKVESVKSGKDSQYHTTVVQTGQFVGDTKPINETDALSGFNSSTIQDSNDGGLTPKRRNRKVPKRLQTDHPPSSPKSAHKLKLNMRPVIFHPCFVVVERISIPSKLKIAKRNNKKNKENEICPLECREMFLRRLCEKRHLPGNQCKLKVVDDKNKQGKHEPSFSRTVQIKRRINTDDVNKPASPTQEKQDGPASLHESASHQPGELITVGTFNISSSNGSKYAVEVPNMVPAPGAFETIGKPTVISTLPLNQGTLNVSESCQSKMGSMCLDSDRSPRSPSSETESAASVAYVDSDFSDTSPVKSPEVISRTDESKTHTITSLEKFDGSQTACLPSSETKESVVQDEPLSLGSSHLAAPSPIDPSEESSKYVEPCSVPENEENVETKIKGDVKEDVEEDSDEEWMNVELEVDPDSEPDEEMDMFLPDNPAPNYVPDPELGLEPEAATTEISSASISNVVLSDKVQRLKAMLAEKMQQVDNLRRQRQIPN